MERRDISTVAPQALFLINNAFVQKLAGELARQIVAEASGDTDVRIDWVCHKIFGRPAFREEKVIARRLLESAINRDSEAPWHDLAHVLLCSNEFIYVD